VSCLVNIDGGEDVGMMLVKNADSKSVVQIGEEIREAGKKIRPKDGDETHKKRMGLLKLLPSFLISVLYHTSIFLTSHLGVNIPGMGLQKDALGSMIVTSVGTFGYIDAYTSFFGSTGQWILLTVNAVHEEAIVVDGKIEIAKIVNVNCVIDHRYLYSGGRGKNLISIFKKVFENP
jgi:pyruvate/2-oxoglutarate dehydrogenase complex dihydrolipoamide acyltransferase (E2) component